MKAKQHFQSLLLVLFVFLTACAVSNSRFFANIALSDDVTYGYTIENPVTIMNHNQDKSIGSANYYIECLRSESGKKLLLIDQKVIANPNYDGTLANMDSHYTGESLTYGNGPTLDLYLLMADEKPDTIKIFINTYVSGIVKVPMGLKFKKELFE